MSEITWYNIIMTSDTTPAPYVASAESVHDTYHLPWYAFNGIPDDASANCHASALNRHAISWLQIDYGEPRFVDHVKLQARLASHVGQTPSRFEIFGSLDGLDWASLGRYYCPLWTGAEFRQFKLEPSFNRYYRIRTYATMGVGHSSWGQVVYGYSTPDPKAIFKDASGNMLSFIDDVPTEMPADLIAESIRALAMDTGVTYNTSTKHRPIRRINNKPVNIETEKVFVRKLKSPTKVRIEGVTKCQ